MPYFILIIFLWLILGCDANKKGKPGHALKTRDQNSSVEPAATAKGSVMYPETEKRAAKYPFAVSSSTSTNKVKTNVTEKKLIDLSIKILKCIKTNDFDCFANYIHPLSGVRFSLYAYTDTTTDQLFSSKTFRIAVKNNRIIKWGNEDGSEREVKLPVAQYFKRFVYDVDFLHAEKKSVNTYIGTGNSLNNLKEIYPDCSFTEFYFSGFDATFQGLDWKTLRLVFKNFKNKTYLIAVIHDQWTI